MYLFKFFFLMPRDHTNNLTITIICIFTIKITYLPIYFIKTVTTKFFLANTSSIFRLCQKDPIMFQRRSNFNLNTLLNTLNWFILKIISICIIQSGT